MKKENLFILVFPVLAILFAIVLKQPYISILRTQFFEQFLLVSLLFFTQTKILSSIKDVLISKNPSVLKSKRNLYLFYTKTAERFYSVYTNTLKLYTDDTITFISAYLNIPNLTDENHTKVKQWLFNSKKLSYKDLESKISVKNKLKIRNKIHNYHLTHKQYEDLFFDCISGQLLVRNIKISIAELILIWVTYFYFMINIFDIDLSNHTTLITAFITISIADISKHYYAYKTELGTVNDGIDSFSTHMYQMFTLMYETPPDQCLYRNIEGELIPFTTIPD